MNRKCSPLTQCLNVFNQKTASGLIYVCTVCLQTRFRTSVYDVTNLTFKSQLEKRTYHEYSQGYVSAESKQWLCITCRQAIKKNQWPKLPIINCHDLEEDLMGTKFFIIIFVKYVVYDWG